MMTELDQLRADNAKLREELKGNVAEAIRWIKRKEYDLALQTLAGIKESK